MRASLFIDHVREYGTGCWMQDGSERPPMDEANTTAEPTIWDLADSRRDDLALADAHDQLSWSQVAERIAQGANALDSLVEGRVRRIAVLGENTIETVLLYASAVMAGIGAVPLNYHLKPEEVAYLLRDSEASVLWTDDAHHDVGAAAVRSVGGSDVTRVVSLAPDQASIDWVARRRAAPSVRPSAERAAGTSMLYTSGTTGYPKAVVRRTGPRTVADQVAAFAQHYAAGLGPHLVVGPLYHTGPHAAVGLLLTGTPVVVLGRFDAERVLQAIEDFAIASSLFVPTHYSRLLALDEPTRRRYDVSSLRVVGQTGSSCPIPIKRAMIDWFGPIIRESYGATESGIISVITSPEWLSHPGSVGRPVDGFTVHVVDQDGEAVAAGAEGRLYFQHSSGTGIEYHGDAAKTADVHLGPGVFTLGEIGRVDADGYIFITDRFADMVVSGGANIYPAECERVVMEHPAVLDAAIVGVPDAEMGERLIGAVVLSASATSDELVEFCRQRLAHYKVPHTFHIHDELPRSPMGKLDKRQLRRLVS
jgi:long-chain acyl-CoA synthetase